MICSGVCFLFAIASSQKGPDTHIQSGLVFGGQVSMARMVRTRSKGFTSVRCAPSGGPDLSSYAIPECNALPEGALSSLRRGPRGPFYTVARNLPRSVVVRSFLRIALAIRPLCRRFE